MKKFFSKSFYLALVVTGLIALSSVSVFASDAAPTKEGFIPSEDSTWGDLYRYFDPEGFASLSLEEKQVYDSTPLDYQTTSPSFINTNTDAVEKLNDITTAFLEENGIELNDYVSVTAPIYCLDDDDLQSRISLELATMALDSTSTTDSINYTDVITPTITCPKFGIATTLYDNDGIYVDFNSESKSNTMACDINDSFDGLKFNTCIRNDNPAVKLYFLSYLPNERVYNQVKNQQQ